MGLVCPDRSVRYTYADGHHHSAVNALMLNLQEHLWKVARRTPSHSQIQRPTTGVCPPDRGALDDSCFPEFIPGSLWF
jgi:hypothetical protein